MDLQSDEIVAHMHLDYNELPSSSISRSKSSHVLDSSGDTGSLIFTEPIISNPDTSETNIIINLKINDEVRSAENFQFENRFPNVCYSRIS